MVLVMAMAMVMVMLYIIALQLRYVIGNVRVDFGGSNAIWARETSPPGGLPGLKVRS